jgi:hypothetical protein
MLWKEHTRLLLISHTCLSIDNEYYHAVEHANEHAFIGKDDSGHACPVRIIGNIVLINDFQHFRVKDQKTTVLCSFWGRRHWREVLVGIGYVQVGCIEEVSFADGLDDVTIGHELTPKQTWHMTIICRDSNYIQLLGTDGRTIAVKVKMKVWPLMPPKRTPVGLQSSFVGQMVLVPSLS